MLPTNALTNNMPVGWCSQNYDYSDHSLVPLENYCFEYQVNAQKVSGSFNKGIESIKRVQNPFLYAQFLLKQEEYKSRGIHFQIKELFHDTGNGKVDSIIRDNFDWRLTNRAKFGRGVSFSPSPSYANKQSSRQNGTNRAMIICDVLVGSTESGCEGQSLPQHSDTTVGNSGSVYVKFYDDEFFPKYVVSYESAPQEYFRRRRHYF